MSALSKAMGVFNKSADTTPAPAEPKPEPALKRWACSYIDWFDYELTTKIVTAENWLEAFCLAYPDSRQNVLNDDESTPETLEKAKENAFNCDSMIHVEEIPEV